MELPEEAIKEFADLYQKRYGRALSVDEAMQRSYGLLGLYKTVYEPDKDIHKKDKTSEPLEIDELVQITKSSSSPSEIKT